MDHSPICDPLFVGRWDSLWQIGEGKKANPLRLQTLCRVPTQDGALVKIRLLGEAIDGNIIADQSIHFDSKARFFQNFPYDGVLGSLVRIDASAGQNPNGNVAPLNEQNRTAIRGKNKASDAFW